MGGDDWDKVLFDRWMSNYVGESAPIAVEMTQSPSKTLGKSSGTGSLDDIVVADLYRFCERAKIALSISNGAFSRTNTSRVITYY